VQKHVETQKKENENRLGSFISLICQDMESRVIEAAREHLNTEGFVVRVNMYDGLMVDTERKADQTRCDAACLTSLEAYVQFAEKPIKGYTVEQVCVSRAVAQVEIRPTVTVVLFGLEGTPLTRTGSVRPGAQERLRSLQEQKGLRSGCLQTSLGVE
jgi:hypothetical protein